MREVVNPRTFSTVPERDRNVFFCMASFIVHKARTAQAGRKIQQKPGFRVPRSLVLAQQNSTNILGVLAAFNSYLAPRQLDVVCGLICHCARQTIRGESHV